MTTANATLQLMVKERVVGRVIGLWIAVQSGVMPFGSLALGALGDRLGLPLTLAIAGAGAVFCTLRLGLGLLIALEVADEPADRRDRPVGGALQPG
jgi:hypothetical protein